MSSDAIEHGVLRANRGHPFVPGQQLGSDDPRRRWVVEPADPRIHFALNCASRSCPPIGVYDGARLDAQLELAMRHIVDAETAPGEDDGALAVSAIFKWYAGDFGGRLGVVELLRRYLPEDDARHEAAMAGDVRLSYRPYDWGLNT